MSERTYSWLEQIVNDGWAEVAYEVGRVVTLRWYHDRHLQTVVITNN